LSSLKDLYKLYYQDKIEDFSIIPAQQSSCIKEFCKKFVEKQSEKVVLLKIMKDEHTERTTGGG
jgi:hypothetical protein